MQEVLSISNFDFLMPALDFARSRLGIGSYYAVRYLFAGSLLLLATSLWFRFGHRLKPRWKHFSAAVICVFLLRVIFFDTVFFWRLYGKTAKPVTEKEFYGLEMIWKSPEYFLQDLFAPGTDYLAVGSSQTRTLFSGNPRFQIFAFAGMRPIDFVLYQEKILSRNPLNVLLYLSDFDIAKIPNFQVYVYAPFQGLKLLKLHRQLKQYGLGNASWVFSLKNIFASIFPEYRYADIPRILANRILLDSFGPRQAFFPLTEKEVFEISSKGLKTLDPAYIGLSLLFIEDFITFCDQHRIRVIIVEGQYNPLAYTQENRISNRITRKKLRKLLKKYPKVVFIPLERLRHLYPKDFTDLVHATSRDGKQFTQHLYRLLRKIDSKDQDPSLTDEASRSPKPHVLI
ncbi:MAG TPA: hypothetical protein PKL97_00670 [Candidatus Omnitrophota bacterium]|nr:hypothetical protein [Candidatus Omnitrophota bacterium]